MIPVNDDERDGVHVQRYVSSELLLFKVATDRPPTCSAKVSEPLFWNGHHDIPSPQIKLKQPTSMQGM